MSSADIESLRLLVGPLRKTEFGHFMISDCDLERYLKAFKTVDLAFQRLLETSAWRREHRVNEVSLEWLGVQRNMKLKKCILLDKRDREGRPVIYVAARNHSIYSRDLQEMSHFMMYVLEEVCKRFIENVSETSCILIDMKDFGFYCMDYSVIKTLYLFLNRHYPERLGVCFLLNAPIIFYACWAIIKTWLDENTRQKIRFIETKELDKFVDIDIIPFHV